MALGSTMVWRVRVSGNAANGGGYDPAIASPGTDYSDQDSPQVTFNGTSITATTSGASSTITITGYTVAATDVANVLRISAGTNYTTGYYTITSVNTGANTWTLDRNVSTGNGSALVARMGGAFAKVNQFANGGSGTQPTLTSPLAPGHFVYIRGDGTSNPSSIQYDHSDGYLQFSAGDTTTGSVTFIGYNGRPCLGGDLFFYNVNLFRIRNIKFKASANSLSPTYGFVYTSGDVGISECIADQAGYDGSFITTPMRLFNVTLENSGSTSAGTYQAINIGSTAAPIFFDGISIDGWRGGGVKILSSQRFALRNSTIVNTKANHGVQYSGSAALYTAQIGNNVLSSNAGDGLRLDGAVGDLVPMMIHYNEFNNNGGYGVNITFGSAAVNDKVFGISPDYNDASGNTSGDYHNMTGGPNPKPPSGGGDLATWDGVAVSGINTLN